MANIKTQQILIPKQVFIGDKAELKCNFNSNEIIFQKSDANADKNLIETAKISISSFVEPVNLNEYEILDMEISCIGVDFYELSVKFIPWTTGKIQFPSLKIGEQILEFSPVNIASITEQTGTKEIKENSGPLLLPYTTYKIFAFLLCFLLLLCLFVHLIVKRKKVMFFIKNQVLKYKYNKNRKKTLRNLYKIADYSDKDFAQDFQHIMRSYLHVKFDYPFENCATSQMKLEFLTITQGLLDDNKSEKFDELVGFFIRTDFIRYGKNCTFENDEKKEIVRKTEEIIKTLEAEGKDGQFR